MNRKKLQFITRLCELRDTINDTFDFSIKYTLIAEHICVNLYVMTSSQEKKEKTIISLFLKMHNIKHFE